MKKIIEAYLADRNAVKVYVWTGIPVLFLAVSAAHLDLEVADLIVMVLALGAIFPICLGSILSKQESVNSGVALTGSNLNLARSNLSSDHGDDTVKYITPVFFTMENMATNEGSLVVGMCIVKTSGNVFTGADLKSLFLEHDYVLDDMQAYKKELPHAFRLQAVSIEEPGCLDRIEDESYRTKGIIIFVRIPIPEDRGQVDMYEPYLRLDEESKVLQNSLEDIVVLDLYRHEMDGISLARAAVEMKSYRKVWFSPWGGINQVHNGRPTRDQKEDDLEILDLPNSMRAQSDDYE